jgi:hypothetical protein
LSVQNLKNFTQNARPTQRYRSRQDGSSAGVYSVGVKKGSFGKSEAGNRYLREAFSTSSNFREVRRKDKLILRGMCF